jgi:hypothetical protein
MRPRILAFLDHAPKLVSENKTVGLCAWSREMDVATGRLCLFDKICKQLNYSDLQHKFMQLTFPNCVRDVASL